MSKIVVKIGDIDVRKVGDIDVRNRGHRCPLKTSESLGIIEFQQL